jgi:hypothetical protein
MEKACHPRGTLLMATDDPIRASDVDREVVVATLRDAFTAGRLTLDEFDERMSAAYASRTWGDLRRLTADLPSEPVLGSDVPGRRLSPPGGLPSHPPRPYPYPPLLHSPGSQSPGSLPEPDSEPQPPAVPPRRRPLAILIPVAIWTLLVVHSGTAHGVVLLFIAVFALTWIMAAIRRR